MTTDHDRIVTPLTDPERWTAEETALYNAGKCSWQTAYGMPWAELCGRRSKPGASFGYCADHEAELLEEHFPDGTPRHPVARAIAERAAGREVER